jgi:DNA-directed RNA polymerase subunit RPC12/RpoP
MKIIKKFEAWAGYPLSTTSLDNELEYKKCKDCDSVYQVYKPKSINCKYCGSKDLLMLSEDEFYNELKNSIDPKEYELALKHRSKIANTFIDLSKEEDDFIN